MKNFTIASASTDLLPNSSSASKGLKIILSIIWILIFSITLSFSQSTQSVSSQISCLKLSLSNNQCSDETVIRFGSIATDKFDNNLDMYKQKNGGKCAMISSMVENINYSINSMPLGVSENKTISLLVDGKSGDYTITAVELSAFDNTENVYIKDKVSNTVQNLKTDPTFKFSKTSADAQDRLSVIFTNEVITSVEGSDLKVKMEDLISIRAEKIVLNRSKLSAGLHLELYNAMGEQVFVQDNIDNNSEENYIIETPATLKGVYIIKAAYQNQMISKKVYLN